VESGPGRELVRRVGTCIAAFWRSLSIRRGLPQIRAAATGGRRIMPNAFRLKILLAAAADVTALVVSFLIGPPTP